MSHDQFSIDGEILSPNPSAKGFYHFWAEEVKRDPTWLSPLRRSALVRNFFTAMRRESSKPVYGTDLKLEQLDMIPWAADTIYSLADRVIILKRMNVLKQVVSYELTKARVKNNSGPVHGRSVPEATTIRLDASFALAQMRRRVDLVRSYQSRVMARHKPHFVVVYEDLASGDCESLLTELQAFLGVEPVALSCKMVNQNPQPLSTLIDNYDEVARAVRQSEFAYTLYLPT